MFLPCNSDGGGGGAAVEAAADVVWAALQLDTKDNVTSSVIRLGAGEEPPDGCEDADDEEQEDDAAVGGGGDVDNDDDDDDGDDAENEDFDDDGGGDDDEEGDSDDNHELIRHNKVPKEDLSFEVLATLASHVLDWRTCGDKLTKEAAKLCEGKSLPSLLPLLKSAVKASYTSLASMLVSKLGPLLAKGEPELVAEVLEAQVAGSLSLESVASRLLAVLETAPFSTVASVDCAKFVAASARRESLEALQPALLLRLTVAATKSKPVAREAGSLLPRASDVGFRFSFT
eukprot:s4603_g3.t1